MTPERLSRFARHIVLPEIGGVGQMALNDAHVVMIGCGGIGSLLCNIWQQRAWGGSR
jgi:molybdopterin/thiamine biosynthesis adenylyltransferase